MALINCPECTTQVSDEALKCTKCGLELRTPERTHWGKLFKFLFVALNILFAIGFAFICLFMVDDPVNIGTIFAVLIGFSIIFSPLFLAYIVLAVLVIFTKPKGKKHRKPTDRRIQNGKS